MPREPLAAAAEGAAERMQGYSPQVAATFAPSAERRPMPLKKPSAQPGTKIYSTASTARCAGRPKAVRWGHRYAPFAEIQKRPRTA